MSQHKVIVIGSGPAGLSAALYLARARMEPLVLAGEVFGGQLMWTTAVENYPGFPDGIQGPELMSKMLAQAEKFGAKVVYKNVARVDFSDKLKKVYAGEEEYLAEAVVITTGAKARMLNIGEEKLLGRGVSTCATCDAAFFKEKEVYVVGGGDVAMEDALVLSRFAKKVTIIHRKSEFRASKQMQYKVLEEAKIPVIWESEVVEVVGAEKLERIKVKNSQGVQELPADGLFLAIGHLPDSLFLEGAVAMDEHKYVITKMVADEANRNLWLADYPTQTSAKGVFAGGDVVDFRYRQAITAAGMGVMAALDAEKFLTGTIASW